LGVVLIASASAVAVPQVSAAAVIPATVPAPVTAGGGMIALTPARIMDTNVGTGGTTGPVAGGATVSLTVLGAGGIPASGVGAVAVNVTVEAGSHAGGYVTVFPHGVTRPNTSNVNFSPNQTIGNLVIVKVGSGGEIDLTNSSGGGIQFLVDVEGWFASGTAAVGGLTAQTPTRVLDTRNGTGGITGPVAKAAIIKLAILGHGGVPASNVGAVALNVTVASPQTGGFITVFPDGVAQPSTSNLNFRTGETFPNLVIVKVGSDGDVDFFNGTGGTVRLIADVQGWFKAAGPAAGGLAAITPRRMLDTRNNTGGVSGPVASGATITLTVQGQSGVAHSSLGAVVLNVTAAASTGAGQLTVYPDGVSPPATTNVSFPAGKTVPELVVVGVGADGKVAFTNSSGETVQIIADVEGWFRTTTPLTDVEQVVASGPETCAVLNSGGADCWGEDDEGSLGAGLTSGPNTCVIDAVHHVADFCSPVPLNVRGVGNSGLLSNVTDLEPTVAGACVLTSGGGVDCWGDNLLDELGNGTNSGPATCGLFPCAPYPEPVVGVGGSGTLSNVTQLASDGGGSCAVLNSGGVDCWGDNSIAELGDGTTTNRDAPVPVVGIGGSGTLANVTHVVSNGFGTGYCAILTGGGVDCWGGAARGQLGNGNANSPDACTQQDLPCKKSPVAVLGLGGIGTLANVTSLVAAGETWCARLNSGAVDCWGDNTSGQVGSGGTEGPDVCIENDAPVACAQSPVQVVGFLGSGTLSNVASLSTDEIGYCALLNTNGLDCWGDNNTGELGIGTSAGPSNCATGFCLPYPVAVEGEGGNGFLSGVTAVVGSFGSFCAAINSGAADCWGDNEFDQLGVGTASGPNLCPEENGIPPCAKLPTRVQKAGGNLTGVTGLSSPAPADYCAILTAGGLACWGDGLVGQLGNGTKSATSDVAVTVLSP
jgi:alpha-tubulin suppressor-like RCC1 family protein